MIENRTENREGNKKGNRVEIRSVNREGKFVLCFLIILCLVWLPGCSADYSATRNPGDTSESDAEKNSPEEILESGGKAEDKGQASKDNKIIAAEFAKDLSAGNFDKLLSDYSYDAKMKEAMAKEDTKKLIRFNNAEYGDAEEFKTPYTMAYGTNQYVMVPVVCSILNFNYQITFDGNHNIIGFTYAGYSDRDLVAEKKIPAHVIETEYSFESDGYVLPGTFTAPEKGSSLPVVILVQGSGPSDRDESLYENKPFRDIAWALAEEGIASFRYDKRTYLYAERVGKDTSFTIDDEIVNDVVAAFQMIKGLNSVNSAKMYVLGHSLGGYVIPRIAEKVPEAAGYIMMSAPAEHMKEFLLEQVEYLAKEDGNLTTEERESIGTVSEQVKLLDAPEDIPENQLVLGAYKDYWVDLNKYNAMEMAEEITPPVLILQGERDYQVTMDQYNLWKGAFESYTNWKFHSYPDLNHLMMVGTGAPNSVEYKTKSYVDMQVIRDIRDFIQSK